MDQQVVWRAWVDSIQACRNKLAREIQWNVFLWQDKMEPNQVRVWQEWPKKIYVKNLLDVQFQPKMEILKIKTEFHVLNNSLNNIVDQKWKKVLLLAHRNRWQWTMLKDSKKIKEENFAWTSLFLLYLWHYSSIQENEII